MCSQAAKRLSLPPPGEVILSDFIPIIPGDYTITVLDPEQGPACTETMSVVVPEAPPGPSIFLLETFPPSDPTADDGGLLIQIETFTVPPYDILLNGLLWGSTSDETFSIDGLESGDYTVQIVDALGCTSNELEVFLPFTQPRPQLETLGGAPTLPPLRPTGSRVEHPIDESLPTLASLGSQLSWQQGKQRYQVAFWQLHGAGLSGQLVQFNYQGGWQGKQWSLYSGPALSYLQVQAPELGRLIQQVNAFWTTDVAWQPQTQARWSLNGQTALGWQEGMWWDVGLQLRVQW